MSEKKVGKRLLTWVLVLVMTLSLLPLNVLAANPAVMRIVRPDTDKYITYNFYLNEGDKTPYYSQIIKNNESLDVPATPEKEGYKFDGWYNGDEQFTTFGTPISVTADSTDVNLYAKFVPVCYVYFMDGTGSDARIIATEMLTPEGSLSSEDFDRAALLVPVGAEQAVIGWTKDDEQVGEVSYVEGGSIYLYPIIANGHWITFDSKGGSYVDPQFVTDTTEEPTAPTKSGYDFAGWYDGDTKFSFGGTLDSNKDLTAHWTAKNAVNYTVIHWLENADDTEYSYKESVQMSGAAGSQTTATAKSYEGFTAQTITQETIAGDGSTIVNVYYKRDVYEVKFYSVKWVPTGLFRGYYDADKLLKTITAKHGAFIGDQWPTINGSSTWQTNPSGQPYQVNIETMPLGGATFYGPKTGSGSETAYYYVEVLPGESGGTLVGGKYYKQHHEDTSPGTGYSVTKEDQYDITGYTFNATISTKIGKKYDNAKFYYTRNNYDVVFVNNGKTVHTQSYPFKASIAEAGSYTPSRPEGIDAAYVFTGWYADPAGAQLYDFDGKTMPAQNITVYAHWAAPVHKVTFMVGETTYKTMVNVEHKATITLPPNPTSTDSTEDFLGWTYQDGKPFNPETKITGDLTLYAKFGSKTGYSVTYVTEGSSPVTDDKLYAEDAYATVLNGPSTAPAGKVFLYWNASSDSSGKKYYPNDKVLVPKGGVTLTAVYGPVAQVLTLTYHSNYPDGTDTTNTTAVESNLKNNALIPVAAKDKFTAPTGYEFDCWNTKADGTGDKFAAGSSARVDNIGSNDLYAQWKPIQITDEITVTIKGNTSTVTYDGTEKSVTGYTVERSDNRYTENDFTFSGTALAKGTDAGTYPMGLKPENFENKNANFSKVTFVVTDGSLTITKREVTLTSASDSKVYDGTALTKPEVTVTGSFVDGEVTDIKATGTITDVGTVTNTITFAKGEKFKDSNYAITKTEGTLEVTPITDKVTVTITGNTKTVRYNGKEQSVTGFTYTAPEGVKVTPKDGFKPEAKGTDKGTYYMYLTKGDFIVSSKIYKEFEIIVKDGYLEITRSGGHHPRPKPTVEIEDDDALGLNTTDHFAYIVGYGNGEVRPQNNITRAEVATIFFRLLTDDVRDENLTKTNRYSDVTRADWYNTAVSTLSSMGIITGYPDGTFRPNAAITRAEFAAIAARFDSNGDKTTAKFSDIATHWAKDEISIAYNNGWITGYPDGTFGPQRDITRAETMTLVNRVLNRQPETEDDLLPNMTVWTDNANPNAWYYLAVQEATNSHYYKFKTNSQYEKWTELRETRDWTQLEK
ncbi:MAG: InlB B-repeat-containing protein [Oscillibacter sp.]